jgi:hypothetical protein
MEQFCTYCEKSVAATFTDVNFGKFWWYKEPVPMSLLVGLLLLLTVLFYLIPLVRMIELHFLEGLITTGTHLDKTTLSYIY